MQAPQSARLEIKFACYLPEFSDLELWLKMHWLGFVLAYPDRVVNNIYFDNYDYRAYAENLSGASERNKVRYRWYGDSQFARAGVLEVKRKRNFFGWKLKYPVANLVSSNTMSWPELRQSITKQIPDEGNIWLNDHPQTVLVNRYSRRYYVSNCQRIRVTFDWGQAVWDQRSRNFPNTTMPGVLPDTVVIEIKFSRDDRELVSRVIQSLPVRVGRHSKYMNGVRAAAM